MAILDKCLEVASNCADINTIDITGGSPEMHPHLDWFLKEASKLNKKILVRSNLVILLEKQYIRYIKIFKDNNVELIGSLPDYSQRLDKQRGEGSFDKSIEALKMLNEQGYGMPGAGLILDLVHNPMGAYLPSPQAALEAEYKNKLKKDFNISFNSLFCITNMPLGRYMDYLVDSSNFRDYINELFTSYNPSSVPNVMWRKTSAVGWDGTLYDCDFNQALELPINPEGVQHINDFDYEKLKNRQIVIKNHCYGCTAGSGSSCQGIISEEPFLPKS
jgi:radical SAM/Cys-rich protein